MQATDRLSGGELNGALTKALVGIQTEHLGRGPVNAVSFHRRNLVVAAAHDVLTNAEKVLARNGNHEDVREFRELFRRVMEADFCAAVERLTERWVTAFLGANHLEPDVAAAIFVLDAPL